MQSAAQGGVGGHALRTRKGKGGWRLCITPLCRILRSACDASRPAGWLASNMMDWLVWWSLHAARQHQDWQSEVLCPLRHTHPPVCASYFPSHPPAVWLRPERSSLSTQHLPHNPEARMSAAGHPPLAAPRTGQAQAAEEGVSCRGGRRQQPASSSSAAAAASAAAAGGGGQRQLGKRPQLRQRAFQRRGQRPSAVHAGGSSSSGSLTSAAAAAGPAAAWQQLYADGSAGAARHGTSVSGAHRWRCL